MACRLCRVLRTQPFDFGMLNWGRVRCDLHYVLSKKGLFRCAMGVDVSLHWHREFVLQVSPARGSQSESLLSQAVVNTPSPLSCMSVSITPPLLCVGDLAGGAHVVVGALFDATLFVPDADKAVTTRLLKGNVSVRVLGLCLLWANRKCICWGAMLFCCFGFWTVPRCRIFAFTACFVKKKRVLTFR